MLSSELARNAKLKVYKGAPHGMCTTHKDQVNEDLLAFLKDWPLRCRAAGRCGTVRWRNRAASAWHHKRAAQ